MPDQKLLGKNSGLICSLYAKRVKQRRWGEDTTELGNGVGAIALYYYFDPEITGSDIEKEKPIRERDRLFLIFGNEDSETHRLQLFVYYRIC